MSGLFHHNPILRIARTTPVRGLLSLFVVLGVMIGFGSQAMAAAEGGHGLTPDALEVFNVFGLPVTNSMLLSWVAALFVIIFAQIAMRKVREVPEGAQNFWEWLVEGLHNFLEDIIGRDLVKMTFWFFATAFIFIFFTNIFGLIPGVGTVGWGTPNAGGGFDHITTPLLRGGNADLNMTLAMSMIFFVCWVYWALKANGPGGFVLHIFGPKGDSVGAMKILMIGVFLAVGVLELVSILFRPVSLSFRLYGNIFAGENLLESMLAISPWFGWLCALPFYFMELMVAAVQALVFMLLTSVFTLLICQHDEDHHKGHGEHAEGH